MIKTLLDFRKTVPVKPKSDQWSTGQAIEKILGYLNELGIFRTPRSELTLWRNPEMLQKMLDFLNNGEKRGELDDRQKNIAKKIDTLLKRHSELRAIFEGELNQRWTIAPNTQTVILAQKMIEHLERKNARQYYQARQASRDGRTIPQSVKDAIGERQNEITIYQEYLWSKGFDEYGRIHGQQQGGKTTKKKSTPLTVQEMGYLATHKLLEYKKQGSFVQTPSRKKYINSIRERVAWWQKVFLNGSTGTGKTKLALEVVHELGGKAELYSAHPGTRQRDMLWSQTLKPNTQGQTIAPFDPGPLTRSLGIHVDDNGDVTYSDGCLCILDEITLIDEAELLSWKQALGAKPGDSVSIPWIPWQHPVGKNFWLIMTGNLADDKTTDRQSLDPAFTREITPMKIDYMPPEELEDILLSRIITSAGVLSLSKESVEMIRDLSWAAYMSQLFHDRRYDLLKSLWEGNAAEWTQITTACGDDINNGQLNQFFWDPKRLIELFDTLDFTQAKGGTLNTHIAHTLTQFIENVLDTAQDEKKLLEAILKFYSLDKLLAWWKTDDSQQNEKDYFLPSEMDQLREHEVKNDSPWWGKKKKNNPWEYPSDGPHWDYEAIYHETRDMLHDDAKDLVKWVNLESDTKYTGNPTRKALVQNMFPDAHNHSNRIPVIEYAPGKRLSLVTSYFPDFGDATKTMVLAPNGQDIETADWCRNYLNPDYNKHTSYMTWDFLMNQVQDFPDMLMSQDDITAFCNKFPYPLGNQLLGFYGPSLKATRNSKWCNKNIEFQTISAWSYFLSSSCRVDGDPKVPYGNVSGLGPVWADRLRGFPSMVHL